MAAIFKSLRIYMLISIFIIVTSWLLCEFYVILFIDTHFSRPLVYLTFP